MGINAIAEHQGRWVMRNKLSTNGGLTNQGVLRSFKRLLRQGSKWDQLKNVIMALAEHRIACLFTHCRRNY